MVLGRRGGGVIAGLTTVESELSEFKDLENGY
jgi:hypothetical protein